MSLNNQGDIDTQSVCGAIMTATHGAGITLPCMSMQMIAARIVTADGSFLDLSAEADGELFKAFRASIGMFGVVVSITLQAVPSYNLLKRSWNADIEDCLDGLHQRWRTTGRLVFLVAKARIRRPVRTPSGVPNLPAATTTSVICAATTRAGRPSRPAPEPVPNSTIPR